MNWKYQQNILKLLYIINRVERIALQYTYWSIDEY